MTSERWAILCRNCNSRLHKLLGVNDAELTPKLLSTYNINTLQVSFYFFFFCLIWESFLDDLFKGDCEWFSRENWAVQWRTSPGEDSLDNEWQCKWNRFKYEYVLSCKWDRLIDWYVLSCKRNCAIMLMPQMLIEKDELQQEQEGVIFILIKINSSNISFLATVLFLLDQLLPLLILWRPRLGCSVIAAFIEIQIS